MKRDANKCEYLEKTSKKLERKQICNPQLTTLKHNNNSFNHRFLHKIKKDPCG